MSIRTMKLTTKRQATLPAELCKELGLHPGDRLTLQRRDIDGKPAWVIQPELPREDSWFGALQTSIQNTSHEMDDIRRSIGKQRGESKS